VKSLARAAAIAGASAALLSACATDPFGGSDPLPYVKYATAGSYMDARTAFTAAPSEEIFRLSVQNWTNAIADASGCRLPPGEVSQASLIAALELAAMSAFARQQGGPSMGDMGRYAADMALATAAEGRYPSRSRCSRLSRWLPEVNRQGGDAVRRATINGLRRGLFGGGS
jgi:hypothetical protein